MTDPDVFARRHFVAIATAQYKNLIPRTLEGVATELDEMRDWLASEDLGSRRFQPAFEELAKGPSVMDVLQAMEAMRLWLADDHVVVYVTGHGVKSDGGHWILFGDAKPINVAAPEITVLDGLRTADLIGVLRDSEVENLLVIIDLCYAGAAAAEIIKFERELPRNWLLLGSATRDREIGVGRLTTAITGFLSELRAGRTNSGLKKYRYNTPNLRIRDFIDGVQERLPGGLALLDPALPSLHKTHPCLPNPGYDPDLDRPRARVMRTDDLEAHWDPRSRGVAIVAEPGVFFYGRIEVMRGLVAAASGPPGTTVVTGPAGSGKSAALARMVTLADPEFLSTHAHALGHIDVDLRPKAGSIDAAIRVTSDRDSATLMRQLCTAVGLTDQERTSLADDRDAWHEWLEEVDRPVTVIVDGLDESPAPGTILDDVLTHLDRPGRPAQVRLIIGLRSSGNTGAVATRELVYIVARRLSANRLAVDRDAASTAADIAGYARNLLSHTPDSPYAAASEDSLEKIVAEITATARGSFVFARTAARVLLTKTVQSEGQLVAADDDTWRHALSRGIAGVFAEDLRSSLPNQDDRLRALDLLRALSFGRGRGLPWSRIWARVANALAHGSREYGDTDIEWLIGTRMAGYMSSYSDNGPVVYGLYHESLRRIFRDEWSQLLEYAGVEPPATVAAVERVEGLIARTLAAIDAIRQVDTPRQRPPDYIRRHLVAHALAGNALDDQVVPPALVPYLDISSFRRVRALNTLSALPLVRKSRRQWDWDDPEANSAAMQTWGALSGAPMAASSRLGSWSVRWAAATANPSEIVGHTASPIQAVSAVHMQDGILAALTGDNDGAIRLWDTTAGTQIGDTLLGHDGPVFAVSSVWTADGRLLGVSGGRDGTVRIWDLNVGNEAGDPFRGHAGEVNAVAAVRIGGRSFAVSAGQDRLLRWWDLDRHKAAARPQRLIAPVRSLAIAVAPSNGYVICGDDAGAVSRWGLVDHELLGRHSMAHRAPVRAVAAVATAHGSIAVTGDDDGMVYAWDLAGSVVEPHALPVQAGRRFPIAALAIANTADGHLSVLGGSDSAILHWRARGIETMGSARVHHGHERPIESIAVSDSPGGSIAFTAGWDSSVRSWSIGDLDVVDGTDPLAISTVSAAVHGDEPLAVIATDDGSIWLRKWDSGAAVGQPLASLAGRPVTVTTLSMSDGRSLVIAGTSSGEIRAWDLARDDSAGRVLAAGLSRVDSMAAIVRPDGTPVLASGGFDLVVRLWDFENGTQDGEALVAGTKPLLAVSMAASADRWLIAAGGKDGLVWLWDGDNRDQPPLVWNVGAGTVRCVRVVERKSGDLQVVAGCDDGVLRMWNPATGEVSTTAGHRGPVWALTDVSAHAPHRLLVSGGDDSTARLWDLNDLSRPVATWPTPAPVLAVAAADQAPGKPFVVVAGHEFYAVSDIV